MELCACEEQVKKMFPTSRGTRKGASCLQSHGDEIWFRIEQRPADKKQAACNRASRALFVSTPGTIDVGEVLALTTNNGVRRRRADEAGDRRGARRPGRRPPPLPVLQPGGRRLQPVQPSAARASTAATGGPAGGCRAPRRHERAASSTRSRSTSGSDAEQPRGQRHGISIHQVLRRLASVMST